MFVMFQGSSKNQNIVDADLSLCDNGGISKLSILMILFFESLLTFVIDTYFKKLDLEQ